MKQFNIYYNDGVFAEKIVFTNKSKNFVKKYLMQEIRRFNLNPNKLYHISFKNIQRVY